MSAASTSLSFSLDALLQPHHCSPPSPSLCNCSSRPSLSLNLSSLRRSRPLRPAADLPPPFATSPPPRTRSLPGDPSRTAGGAFLGPDALDKLQTLDAFRYARDLPHGSLEVRLMAPGEVAATVLLLAESFADALWIPPRYVRVLAFLLEQYVVQKRAQLPNAATLVVYYTEKGGGAEEEAQFAGTAEVSFNALGGNVSPPSPVPPRDAPYICNMSVKETLRRRGIGWHLLKACEELISKMGSSTDVYLHCRVIDSGPLNLYRKAGYSIIKTDNFLVWLRLQQRKHLLCKKLASYTSNFDDESI